MEDIRENIARPFQQKGMNDYEVKVINNKKPHYLEADSLLVRKLYEIYVKHTGDRENPIRVTSAGTYAAEMENSVIFGGEFPDESAGNAHMAGEYGSEDAFIKTIGIYAEALWELGNL
jgi:succinyl-diaminopimelate desuccinylase